MATTSEQRALWDAIGEWAAAAAPVTTVRAREPGADGPDSWRSHWPDLVGLGVFAIALPEAVGGAGGTVLDLAVAVERLADTLVPGPVLPSLLAGLVLADHAETPLGKELLPRLADGSATAAVAMDAGEMVGTEDADGRLVVHGTTGPVLGGGEADHLMLAAHMPDGGPVWFLVDAADVTRTERTPVDFSRSLTMITVPERTVPAHRVLPAASPDRVRDLAATLGVAEAAGVAGWCLRTATGYAKVREQFGRPIGSFQAIKHLLVDMLCRVEQAGALAWDAARALDEPDQHPLAVAAAAAVALDAAVDNAKDCVQVLGGIGFTWEHDAHLYLRRAVALRALLGGGAGWRRRATELAGAGVRRDLRPRAVDTPRRAEIRELVGKIAALPAEQRRIPLAEQGLLAPHWPKPYGLDATPAEQLVIDQELAAAGVCRPDLVIGWWAAPTILRHGSDAQRDRFVLPTLRGEITWCQLFSEPGAGSDLASLRTRAEPVPGGWRLSGQKVWTSLAARADWAICLARTDPDAPKHQGISYFLVDMRSPGIDIRPLREITGEAVFNEVFLDGVFVPDDCLVGPLHGGWRLARTTLANERVAMSGAAGLGEGLENLLASAASRPVDSVDDGMRERLGRLVATALGNGVLELRATLRSLDGRGPGPESSVRKLVGVAHRQAVAETAVELFGPDGASTDGALGPLVHEFLLSRCLSIAGGTSQILRTLAAERILDLPR